MKIVNEPNREYSLCEVCNEMIGPNAPVISMSYGFIEGDGLYSEDSVVIHSDCSDSSILGRLLEKVEQR